jgi:hypothetical protein
MAARIGMTTDAGGGEFVLHGFDEVINLSGGPARLAAVSDVA